MIQLRMCVEAASRVFASCCVWRVNEEHHISAVGMLSKDVHTIAINERDVFSYLHNVLNTLLECCGIPTRSNTFSIFTLINEARAWSQNATTIYTVSQYGSKRLFS